MSGKRERMSAVDAAWLRMDSPTQRMVITAAFRFAEPLSLGDVHQLVTERVLQHVRFRQRVVAGTLWPRAEPGVPGAWGQLGTPYWEECPDLAPGPHLHERVLDAPRDDDALAELLGELAGEPLDLARPLWSVHLIQGHPAGPVLVVRLHHAIGDGVSLVELLLALTDHGPIRPPAVGLHPRRARGLAAMGRTIIDHTTALGRMVLLSGDPKTVFRGELGPKKRVAWTRGFPLDELRATARRHDAKLNDLLVSVVAGALRRYLLGREGPPKVAELRALVPVFLEGHRPQRSEDAGAGAEPGTGTLGNHFGLVFVPLLIGIADAHERLRASKVSNDRMKASPDAAVALEVLAVMGAAGPAVEGLGIDLFTRKASCMITNVPGPSGPLRLAGRAVTDLFVWAPVAGHIGTGISLVTYDGRARIGIVTDAHLVPDPQVLARACEAEVAALGP